jgi:hypothetical protein
VQTAYLQRKSNTVQSASVVPGRSHARSPQVAGSHYRSYQAAGSRFDPFCGY